MDNRLRDSIWQGLGAIIAFLTLLLSVLFLLKKSNRKDISYRVILIMVPVSWTGR
jgi:heme A synthase